MNRSKFPTYFYIALASTLPIFLFVIYGIVHGLVDYLNNKDVPDSGFSLIFSILLFVSFLLLSSLIFLSRKNTKGSKTIAYSVFIGSAVIYLGFYLSLL
jgi:uncharacterized oligopeptide transporter (OPT) family protein